MTDDRQDFEIQRRRDAARMGGDEALTKKAVDMTSHADRYSYSYMWNWLGLPIIQMPPDIVVLQEIIWENAPQVVIETGIARGGSVILYSSILELLGEGHVVAVDVDIRAHNRQAIEDHPLSRRIRLVEGSSTDEKTFAEVREQVGDAERVMVVLDSDHTHDHVLAELRLYAPLVTSGQFLVVADTLVEEIPEQHHRPRNWGPGNNPKTALDEYLNEDDRFEIDTFINDKLLMTSSRDGYLRRVTDR